MPGVVRAVSCVFVVILLECCVCSSCVAWRRAPPSGCLRVYLFPVYLILRCVRAVVVRLRLVV